MFKKTDFYPFLSAKIKIKIFRKIYNVDFHPRVKSGAITKDQAFREFMKNFADKNGDGIITREVVQILS
jgi:hypothetical protein